MNWRMNIYRPQAAYYQLQSKIHSIYQHDNVILIANDEGTVKIINMVDGNVINNLAAGGSKLMKSKDTVDHPLKPGLSLV